MATAKTKEPEAEVETETEPAKDDAVVTKGNLRDMLKELFPDLFARDETVDTEVEPEKDGKRPTARDEEARTYKEVLDAIKEFKEAFTGKEAEGKEKAEPETVPASSAVRWIENFLWGKE